MSLPTLAITMGDPAGVGPEIIVKALSRRFPTCAHIPVIIGSERALKRAMQHTGMEGFQYQLVDSIDEVSDQDGVVYLLNDESHLGDEIPLGQVHPACGASAYHWLTTAIELAQSQRVDAIVTAPLHKEALNQAGYHFPGHTEILAEQTSTAEYALMLISGGFRVAHVSCHCSIKEVPSLVTKDRVKMVIRLFHQALERIDQTEPVIAVNALNPHGGEGGLFGDEEIHHIRPAVEECQQEGIRCEGPIPADSVYPQLIGGKYNGVVAMYHDQGHIPFKLANFGFDPNTKTWRTITGVNVTLGLPILRTSVDHGTAFDLAGTGTASEQSLLDAIDIAVRLSADGKHGTTTNPDAATARY